MKLLRILSISLLMIVSVTAAAWAADKAKVSTELKYYGHAAFSIKTPSGNVILIDPWITNPANKTGADDLAKIEKADLILITHGHFDHVGDSIAIAKKTGAKLVATFDLATALKQYAGFPKDQMGFDTLGNFGGEISLLNGEVKIAFVPAIHSSTVTEPEGAQNIHTGGAPGGFVVTVRKGPTIYHTGDTDVFGDMALLNKFHNVDVMLATIGGHFTMGPERAAEAVQLVKPKLVVPMHYGTFPVLTGNPDALGKALKKRRHKTKMVVMEAGNTLKF